MRYLVLDCIYVDGNVTCSVEQLDRCSRDLCIVVISRSPKFIWPARQSCSVGVAYDCIFS